MNPQPEPQGKQPGLITKDSTQYGVVTLLKLEGNNVGHLGWEATLGSPGAALLPQ